MRNVEREHAWNKANRRVGEWLETIDEDRTLPGLDGGRLQSILVRVPAEDRPECLLVLKASVGTEKFVAFVGGLTVSQAILSWRAKGMAKGLKWKVDQPWGDRLVEE